jgi:aryl-alcohol dehydrogenase-like predicted oxidoreductase
VTTSKPSGPLLFGLMLAPMATPSAISPDSGSNGNSMVTPMMAAITRPRRRRTTATSLAHPRQSPGSELNLMALMRAWVLRHPAVSAPIVGATKPHHLAEAAAALDLTLTDDEAATLEEPYTNYGPSWY